MADEAVASDGTKKKAKMRTLGGIAGLLAIEAVVIIGAMSMLGGDPDVAAAAEAELDATRAEEEKIVEVMVLDAKLPNARSGVSYLYSTEVYAQVRYKHSEKVSARVEQFYNEIKAEITAIWRTSEPHHFQEPKLENLTRKVGAMLNQRFGIDPETDEAIVVKCVIVMGTGFRVDR